VALNDKLDNNRAEYTQKIHRSEHEQKSVPVHKNINKFGLPLTEPVRSTTVSFQ
jgi:hypothetical protein